MRSLNALAFAGGLFWVLFLFAMAAAYIGTALGGWEVIGDLAAFSALAVIALGATVGALAILAGVCIALMGLGAYIYGVVERAIQRRRSE